MPDFAVRTAFSAKDKLSPAFNRMGKNVDKFGQRAQKGFLKADKGASRMMTSLKGMLPLFGGALLARIGANAIELASDLTEVQNVVDVTFTKGASVINNFAKTAIEKFGLSELQAKEFTGTLGSMAKSSGIAGDQLVKMTTDLVGLAGDYASFRNMQPEQVFEKMQSVVTGTTQPLRELGFNMTIANLSAFALSKGITKSWKSMSQAEQVMLRYNFIMSNSKDAQGDFNKTLSTSFANQKRVLGVRFDQFLAEIATKILPALIDGFKILNTAVRSIDTDTLGTGLKLIVKILPPIIIGFIAWKVALISVAAWQGAIIAIGWIKYLWMMRQFITAATIKQWLWNAALNANPIGLVVLAITALITVGILLYRNWDLVKRKFMEWTAIFDNPIFATVAAIFLPFITIPILIARNWDLVVESIANFAAVVPGYLSTVGGMIMTALMFPINSVVTGIIKLLQLASSLPLVGDQFADLAQKAQQLQDSANSAVGATNPLAPNRGAGQKVQLDGNININNAPQGTTANSKVKGANPINMNVVGANA